MNILQAEVVKRNSLRFLKYHIAMNDNPRFRNASVVIVGFACLILCCNFVFRLIGLSLSNEENYVVGRWLWPVISMVTPIFFGWVGILLRQKFPEPKSWVKVLLAALIPGLYIFWTFMHLNGIHWLADGVRCSWIYTAVLCYLIPTSYLEKCKDEVGLIDLMLFLASAFCYVGVCRVEWHFSVANFQMLTGLWTKFFCRAMNFIPLAMSVFFLARFAFSKSGQKLGRSKVIGWSVQIISVIYFLTTFFAFLPSYHQRLYYFYKLLFQPVSIYLLVVASRIFKGLKKQSASFSEDIFS